jgi:hypothetical protein
MIAVESINCDDEIISILCCMSFLVAVAVNDLINHPNIMGARRSCGKCKGEGHQ